MAAVKRRLTKRSGDSERSLSSLEQPLASAEDIYKMGCELSELRKQLQTERAQNKAMQISLGTQQRAMRPVSNNQNDTPIARKASIRSARLSISTSSATSQTEEEIGLGLPRSMANTTLSSMSLDKLSASPDTPSHPMHASHQHGASLSKIPRHAVNMNRALTATTYDVSRSKSPFPEETDDDVFAIPELPNTPATPSRRASIRVPPSPGQRRSSIPMPINSPAAPLSSSQRSTSSTGSHRSRTSSSNSQKTALSPALTLSSAAMTPATSTQSAYSNASSTRSTNKGGVFFGSTDHVGARHAARVQSAASGTGKVLSDLQIDLSNVRGALETTKNQLRVSSRAVESLSNQLADALESKERLKLENDGLTKILNRKERMLDEMQERAITAEGQIEHHRELVAEKTARCFDLNERCAKAEEASRKSANEYKMLETAHAGLADSFRSETDHLGLEFSQMQARHRTELEGVQAKHQALSTLLASRQSLADEIKIHQQQVDAAQKAALSSLIEQLAALSGQVSDQSNLCSTASTHAHDLTAEFQRIRRLMREQAE